MFNTWIGSMSRLVALWAVMVGTSPLPILLASAEAAPLTNGSVGDSDAFDMSDVVSLGAVERPVAPASLGTLDELVLLWPALAHAEGIVAFIDFEEPLDEGFPIEVWSIKDGIATVTGRGSYTPLHHGETLYLSPEGPVGPDGPNGDLALALNVAIGTITAQDGALFGTAIGLEGLVLDIPLSVLPDLEPSGWPELEPDPLHWGQAPVPALPPTPVVPLRTMPAPQAVDEATEQQALDDAAVVSGHPVNCINPNWLGHNGIECCALYLSPANAAIGCRGEMLVHFMGCMGIAMTPFVYHALLRCISPPTPLTKACVAAILGVVVGAAIVCWLAAKWANMGCVQRALQENAALLATAGCKLTPPTGGN